MHRTTRMKDVRKMGEISSSLKETDSEVGRKTHDDESLLERGERQRRRAHDEELTVMQVFGNVCAPVLSHSSVKQKHKPNKQILWSWDVKEVAEMP